MKKILIISLICLLAEQYAYAIEGIWATIDYPGAYGTQIFGIDGSNVVGIYSDDFYIHSHGFLYNIATQAWIVLDKPGAGFTKICGVEGTNLVGYYSDNSGDYHGFLYNTTDQTWTTLDAPGNDWTLIYGISGNNLVGEESFYDTISQTWQTFRMPGATASSIYGIDGNNLVGYYYIANPPYANHGFSYNMVTQTWSNLDMPGALDTFIYDIDGSNIVGYTSGAHGFLYDGTTWAALDVPEATGTLIHSIDGNKIAGTYLDASNRAHGFVYEILRPPIACIADVDQPIEAQGLFGTKVTLDGSCSSDADSAPGTNDDINDFNWYRLDPADSNNEIFLGSGQTIDCNLPLGTHTIVLEVTDKAGESDSNEITITIEDTTPPEFNLSVSPTILWPANHKMIKITPTFDVNDLCDPSPKVSLVDIVVNEPNNANDIQISDDGSIYLCATRTGNSEGRIYTITYQACDSSDNCTTRSCTVIVPHDHRK